jgi:hypothetical protein
MLRIPHCLDNRLTVNCEILATCSSTYSTVRISQEAHSFVDGGNIVGLQKALEFGSLRLDKRAIREHSSENSRTNRRRNEMARTGQAGTGSGFKFTQRCQVSFSPVNCYVIYKLLHRDSF